MFVVGKEISVHRLLLISGRDTYRGHANGAFFGAIDANDCVNVVVVERADLACAEVQADGG